MHLTQFTLLHDRFPPPPPRDVNGVVAADGLTLRWAPGGDPSGSIAQIQLFVDGAWYQTFDATQYETKMGPIAAGDPRTFVFTETDSAGNISAPTTGLRALPRARRPHGRRRDAGSGNLRLRRRHGHAHRSPARPRARCSPRPTSRCCRSARPST